MERLARAVRPYLIGGGIVALLAGGGWAFAASNTGVIHACASKRSGALRLGKKCQRSEHAVTWNVQGPQGKQGNPGTPGSSGQTGAAGPSDIYVAGVAAGSLTSGAEITSLTVPPGSYLIEAKVGTVGSAPSQRASCFIAPSTAGGPGSWDGSATLLPTSGAEATLSLAGADTFKSQQTIVLDCASSPTGASYNNVRLWAINTGSLHAALPIPTGD
jgi:hypothetical protein